MAFRRTVSLLVLLLALSPATRASARDPRFGPPVVVVPNGPFANYPVTADCWVEQHYFDSLRTGPIEYCRKNLRFRPGALECLTYVDRVCNVWFPDRQEWDVTRSSNEPRLIRCPEGPEPPSCPRLGVPRTLGSAGR